MYGDSGCLPQRATRRRMANNDPNDAELKLIQALVVLFDANLFASRKLVERSYTPLRPRNAEAP